MLGFYYGGTNTLALGRWNDFNDGLTTHFAPFTYVVEFEPQSATPEPASNINSVGGNCKRITKTLF